MIAHDLDRDRRTQAGNEHDEPASRVGKHASHYDEHEEEVENAPDTPERGYRRKPTRIGRDRREALRNALEDVFDSKRVGIQHIKDLGGRANVRLDPFLDVWKDIASIPLPSWKAYVVKIIAGAVLAHAKTVTARAKKNDSIEFEKFCLAYFDALKEMKETAYERALAKMKQKPKAKIVTALKEMKSTTVREVQQREIADSWVEGLRLSNKDPNALRDVGRSDGDTKPFDEAKAGRVHMRLLATPRPQGGLQIEEHGSSVEVSGLPNDASHVYEHRIVGDMPVARTVEINERSWLHREASFGLGAGHSRPVTENLGTDGMALLASCHPDAKKIYNPNGGRHSSEDKDSVDRRWKGGLSHVSKQVQRMVFKVDGGKLVLRRKQG